MRITLKVGEVELTIHDDTEGTTTDRDERKGDNDSADDHNRPRPDSRVTGFNMPVQ